MVATFQVPVPDSLQQDPDSAEYFRALNLFINDLVAPEGVIATGTATAATVVTQGEKLEFITVTQSVDLDTVEAQAASNVARLDSLLDSLPNYTISNDGTDRTFNADSAAGAITNPPTQAEVENLRDTTLEIADILATVIRDLSNKDIFS